MCVCVCVCETERERERVRAREAEICSSSMLLINLVLAERMREGEDRLGTKCVGLQKPFESVIINLNNASQIHLIEHL